jgi:alanyl-tRNA synthetase
MPTGSEIRETFLRFFEEKGHKRVHSSSLVPANDPTLLFTNAGMNQFKDVFLGLETRDYKRATTSQKCVRAGGKHNDLENVGFTNRHHTFFEMLGNFSFGDYFKKDAIAYAWELITSDKWFGIAKDKLYVTIFNGEGGVPRDSEAYDLWIAQGVAKDRIFEFGAKDNFWQMGDTGPCGPCSEIHYDMGLVASDSQKPECMLGECKFGCDCGRYVEIWNLVFMQFNRVGEGVQFFDPESQSLKYPSYRLEVLPKPSIDTGAGLERLASVLQGKISNYDTDLFEQLMSRAAELTVGPPKDGSAIAVAPAASMRVIADHSRASTFLISDGVLPSNEGRGYVLRKIIRRAITHGRLAGQAKPFLNRMVFAVRDLMHDAYPELNDSAERAARVIREEETRFAHTIDVGLAKLEQQFDEERKRIDEQHPDQTSNVARSIQRLQTDMQHVADKVARMSSEIVSEASHAALRNIESMSAKVAASLADVAKASHGHVDEARREVAAVSADLGGIMKATVETPLPDLTFAVNQFRIDLMDACRALAIPLYPGEEAFKLYDTYGTPFDFIEDAARDQGVQLDYAGFIKAMAEQRERARASWKGGTKKAASPIYVNVPRTDFEGYETLRSVGCKILFVIQNGRSVEGIKQGDTADVILDRTPFYAESGGQVGDAGRLIGEDHQTVVADVTNCYFPVQGVRAHRVVAKGLLIPGNYVDAFVDENFRKSTMRNHTATHLLQAGLREVLGKHVKQAGSLVAPNHLRFDFSHFTSVADEELQDIEDLINKEVLRNQKVEVIENVPIDVAINEYKAMALFGEKYGDRVRVIKIGDFSTELCGGTHTNATGEIGLIKVLKEGSVSSGVRRIEAVTGEGSLHHFRKDHELEGVVASLATHSDATSPAEALKFELDKKDSEIKRLQRELDQARMKSASSTVASVTDKIKDIHGIKVLAHRVDNLERAQMRTLVDQLRDKLGSGVVVLGSANNGNVALIVGVTKDLTSRIQAGKVIASVAEKVDGKGGGRPDLAEAGGKNPEALDAALAEAYGVVESMLT